MNKNVIIHTESDDDYLCHWKYIKRYKKNGHWVYVYDDKQLHDLRDKQKENLNIAREGREAAEYYKRVDRDLDRSSRYVNSDKNKALDRDSANRKIERSREFNNDLKKLNRTTKIVTDLFIEETGNKIKKRKASKSVALGNKVADILTSGSEKIAKGKEYLKKLVK